MEIIKSVTNILFVLVPMMLINTMYHLCKYSYVIYIMRDLIYIGNKLYFPYLYVRLYHVLKL